jgi:hypothetical protein
LSKKAEKIFDKDTHIHRSIGENIENVIIPAIPGQSGNPGPVRGFDGPFQCIVSGVFPFF